MTGIVFGKVQFDHAVEAREIEVHKIAHWGGVQKTERDQMSMRVGYLVSKGKGQALSWAVELWIAKA